MKIMVTVKTQAGVNRVEQTGAGQFKVSVTAAPEKGKANDAVIEALSDYWDVARSRVTILKGHTARKKTVEILGL